MHIRLNIRTRSLILYASLLLIGCSSGGGSNSNSNLVTYKGNTAPAQVDAVNAEDLGTASSEALISANKSGGSLPTFASFHVSQNTTQIETLSQQILSSVKNHTSTNLPTSFSEAGSCGGSISIPDSQLQSEPVSGPYSLSITFTNYCDSTIDNSTIFNGQVNYSTPDVNSFTDFTFQYINFTVTTGGETVTLNTTMTCTSLGCDLSSDFVSSDGSTHRTSEISISGTPTTGLSGSLTFFHNTYGSINVTATSVSYGGCGIFPDGGSISFSGSSGSSGSITFASNCTYSGDYDDGNGDTGVFSGSFTS